MECGAGKRDGAVGSDGDDARKEGGKGSWARRDSGGTSGAEERCKCTQHRSQEIRGVESVWEGCTRERRFQRLSCDSRLRVACDLDIINAARTANSHLDNAMESIHATLMACIVLNLKNIFL